MPGGGLSPDGERWISCRPGFFLPVRVLSRLFRRLFLEQLAAAYLAGQLQFFGDQAALADTKHSGVSRSATQSRVGGLREAAIRRPGGGAGLPVALHASCRHRQQPPHRVRRAGVTFKWKDYRASQQQRAKVMTLAVDEFIRRFLIHVLPSGFHRIRHYGLFANGGRAENIARARQLLDVPEPPRQPDDTGCSGDGEPQPSSYPCPCCGGRMIVIETFERGCTPRHQPTQRIRIDSS